MSNFEDISDELLACYLDGNCSEMEVNLIENAVSSIDDLSVLMLSHSAMSKVDEQMEGLPSFDKGKAIKFEPYTNLRAAGFLGNQEIPDTYLENELKLNDKNT